MSNGGSSVRLSAPDRVLAPPRPPRPPRAPPQSNENVAPAVIMKLAKELRTLSSEPLDGIKVVLNEDDVTDINAEISGPGAR